MRHIDGLDGRHVDFIRSLYLIKMPHRFKKFNKINRLPYRGTRSNSLFETIDYTGVPGFKSAESQCLFGGIWTVPNGLGVY